MRVQTHDPACHSTILLTILPLRLGQNNTPNFPTSLFVCVVTEHTVLCGVLQVWTQETNKAIKCEVYCRQIHFAAVSWGHGKSSKTTSQAVQDLSSDVLPVIHSILEKCLKCGCHKAAGTLSRFWIMTWNHPQFFHCNIDKMAGWIFFHYLIS